MKRSPTRLLFSALRKTGPADIFTFIQKLPDATPKYRYPLEWDNVAALPISTFFDWWEKRVDFMARKKVRKATKAGIEVRGGIRRRLSGGIVCIYNESLFDRASRSGTFGKELEAVKQNNATFQGPNIFLGALLQNELIGFIKLVTYVDGCQASLLQTVSMI